jgi:hypothetical protein
MTITLKVVDVTKKSKDGKNTEFTFEIPFPTEPLSVTDAAKLALKMARDHGYGNRPPEWSVTLKDHPVHSAVAYRADSKYAQRPVPDDSTLKIQGQKRLNSDVWVLE